MIREAERLFGMLLEALLKASGRFFLGPLRECRRIGWCRFCESGSVFEASHLRGWGSKGMPKTGLCFWASKF